MSGVFGFILGMMVANNNAAVNKPSPPADFAACQQRGGVIELDPDYKKSSTGWVCRER